MDTTTIIITAFTALATALAGLAAAGHKLWTAVAPLLSRRTTPVVVLATEDEPGAAEFVASIRGAGYKAVERTRRPEGIPASARAVILWRPAAETVGETIETIRDCAPEAVLLVLSGERLPVMPSDVLLLSNSTLRLRSDLAALAES